MKREYERLKEHSFTVLFSAAVRKLFENKAVRLVTGAAAVLISVFLLDHVRAYHSSGIWYRDFLLFLIPYVAFIASGAYFLSNIGRFSVRKLCVCAIEVGAMLWVAASVHAAILNAWYENTVGLWVVLCFLERIPILVVSLAPILLPVIIKSRAKKSA
ncbi:MAG: hypothetical protein HDR72_03355 [Ruminococcaceae bacterium]|nr:hypothetical protein [Oscillospiraceae bacterium]